ncbi:MAG: TIGR03435 family protein [Vicinamibacterales bacterium]
MKFQSGMLIIAIAVGSGAVAVAQDARKTFEVASVKRNMSGANQATVQVLPNGVNIINQPFRTILQLAYEINQPFRIVGGPSWITTDRFDIVAKTATEVPSGELRPMLQALLVERFNLVARKEKRPFPAYALVLARKDGTLGPQLKQSTVECAAPPGGRGGPEVKPSPTAVACGPRPGGGPGRVWLVGTPLPQMAVILALTLGQTVIDKTGLTGRFDVDLSFAPDPARQPAGVEIDPASPVFARPSLFTAVEEQLGLKLEPYKEDLEALIVERVDPLKEN